MSTLTIRTGNVNMRESSATCAPYLATADNDGKGLTLREAIAHSGGIVARAGTPQFVPSIPHKPKEVCGSFCTQTIELREDNVMRFLVMIRPEWGDTAVTTNLYIMARNTAALRVLKIRVGDSEDLVHNTFEIAGRFELLTGEQAATEGAFVDEKFINLSGENRQQLVISSLEEIEPEISKRKRLRKRRVSGDSGEKVVIRERTRRRGIQL